MEQDLKAKGVKNLRLRTRGDIFSFYSSLSQVSCPPWATEPSCPTCIRTTFCPSSLGSHTWLQTQEVGRSSTPVTLSMPPILAALQCSSAPPALSGSDSKVYLAQRRVRESRARSHHRPA
mmetsp:Transcript_49559/g.155257  ORF Transcript_49559/g.155257 Transcript_49559/m.155257 type:complete len:120 (-) Transcript_49559:367-726(-)